MEQEEREVMGTRKALDRLGFFLKYYSRRHWLN